MPALVAAALLILGGVWWLLDSTVPVSSYDDVVAELDATRESLASSEIDYEDVVSELDATREELASTREAISLSDQEVADDAILARYPQVEPAALLLGYFAGVDPEIVDQSRYESWSGVVKLDMAVEATNDPELTELYWEHMEEGGFSPGSEELVLRLIELTIEPILRGG